MIDWHNPPNLADVIKKAGLTQKQFALEAKVSPSSLCRIFKGKNLPSWENLRKIEKAYAKLTNPAPKRAPRKVAQKASSERLTSADAVA